MPFYNLYPSEEGAIRDFSEQLHREGLLASEVCEALGCSRTELERWSDDGRLPYAGWRHVYFYRPRWEEAWLAEAVDRARPQLVAWRARDTSEREWQRKLTRMMRSRREHV